MQTVSVIAPVGRALESTRQILFAPFDLVKWLGLGFTAWLASLTSGGFNTGFNFNFPSTSPHISATAQAAWNWVQAHLIFVITLAVIGGLFFLAVMFVIMWLSSRGKFMFLDNVVTNRGEIRDSWHQYRSQGNSYFLFSIGLGLATLAILLTILSLSIVIAIPDISRHHFGANAVSALIIGGVLFTATLLGIAIVEVLLDDFVVPLMALRSGRVLAAWGQFLVLLKAQPAVFALYLLFKVALWLAVMVLTTLICCLLCCTVLIPYVGTVILLPIAVFWRSYPLYFMEQFGDNYRLFTTPRPPYLTLKSEPEM